MGNAAKLMLVGVLALVIAIAVIWDRQSSDLKKAAIVTSEAAGSNEEFLPTLTGINEEATGTITMRQKTEAELAAEVMLEEMRSEFLGSEPVARVQESRNVENISVQQTSSVTEDAPRETIYIVKEGESFWTIARDKYGDGSLWKKLWNANKERFLKPEMLTKGATIRLPKFNTERVEIPVQAEVPVRNSNSRKTEYVVKSGDCLSVISQKFYGTSKKWKRILKANNLSDDTSLRVGMKLVIPADS